MIARRAETDGPRSLGVLHPTFEVWGGAEWYIHHAARALEQRRGLRVVLHTDRWSDPPGDGRACARTCHRRGGMMTGPWDWRRIARTQAPLWKRHDMLWVHNYPATAWYGEACRVASMPPAVWYCHEPATELYGLGGRPAPAEGAAPRRSAAAAWSARGVRLPWRLYSRLRRRLAVRALGSKAWLDRLRRLDRESVARFPVVLANSRYTAGRVEEVYGRQATVVYPLPPDLADFAPPPSSTKAPVVLWVGRMSAAKRPLDLLEAWLDARRECRRLREEYRLCFVGDGPLRAEVERRAGTRADSGVEIASGITRRELRERYRSARLTVHLGLAEPFGLVPLESMASGTPVLAHRDGGIPETLVDGRTGWCVPDLDRERLAGLLSQVPSREGELETMGREALSHVARRFRFVEMLERLEAALARAASLGRPAEVGATR